MNRASRFCRAACMSLLLASCGGGSGGGGGSSPPPSSAAPTITALQPASVAAGSYDQVIYVTGSGFTESTVAQDNGAALPTQYMSGTLLQITLPAAAIASGQTVSLTANNGQGTSAPKAVQLTAAAYSLNQISFGPPTDLAWDAKSQRFYATIPGGEIAVIDPVSSGITTASSNLSSADHLAVSDDGQYLYVYQQGSTVIQRLLLPALSPDLSITVPTPVFDMKVAPGAPHTIAVAGTQMTTLTIYDDAVARPHPYNDIYVIELAWGADSHTLYGRSVQESTNTFCGFTVDSNGANGGCGLPYPVVNGAAATGILFDPSSGLVHLGTGAGWSQALDPAADQWAGRFDAPGLVCIDAALKKSFFVFYTAPGTQRLPPMISELGVS